MSMSRAIAVAVGLLGVSMTAEAQNPAGMPGQVGFGGAGMGQMGAGNNPLMLLLAPALQSELKLTDEQKNQVYEKSRESSQRSREIVSTLFSPAGFNPQEVMMAGAALRQENDRLVSKILKPEQKTRLDQVVLQIEGPLAVARPEIAAKIGLTAAQKPKVQAVMEQSLMAQRQTFMALRANGGLAMTSPDAGREQMERVRAATVAQLSKIVTRKQKDAFAALLGDPFDLSKIDPAYARRSEAAEPAKESGDSVPAKKSPRRKAK